MRKTRELVPCPGFRGEANCELDFGDFTADSGQLKAELASAAQGSEIVNYLDIQSLPSGNSQELNLLSARILWDVFRGGMERKPNIGGSKRIGGNGESELFLS